MTKATKKTDTANNLKVFMIMRFKVNRSNFRKELDDNVSNLKHIL